MTPLSLRGDSQTVVRSLEGARPCSMMKLHDEAAGGNCLQDGLDSIRTRSVANFSLWML